MKKSLAFDQAIYFDNLENQYKKQAIIKPPLHTKLEIEEIETAIKQKNPPVKKVVDFGSGNGRLSIPLLSEGFEVEAVDVSEKSLRNLKELAKELGRAKGLKTAAALRGNQEAAIVGADILHHVDLEKTLAEIYQKLEPGGVAAFSEPGAGNLFWYLFITFFLDWRAEKLITQCNYFNLKSAFSRSGYKNISVKGLGLLPRFIFSFSTTLCRLNDWLGDLPVIKMVAYRYIITATK
ncbi:class I SAM-dependent methyltransferase [Patescibacteria group bacterium]|nr:class I SAM-dependent methyltransferase [Patescibacteria group bacterium]